MQKNMSFIFMILIGSVSLLFADESIQRYSFSENQAGKLPEGWESAKTGEGEGSVWEVVSDNTSPSGSGYVLAQTAKGPKRLYNLCVLKDSSFQNGKIQVKFKSSQGEIDQGGGIVWRYQDANNYYICRYNPLEKNYRVYKVVDGKRSKLETKESLIIPAGEWHTLEVHQKDNKITCLLDGTPYLEATDETFTKSGKVGLWTKADAQTYFDELVIE